MLRNRLLAPEQKRYACASRFLTYSNFSVHYKYAMPTENSLDKASAFADGSLDFQHLWEQTDVGMYYQGFNVTQAPTRHGFASWLRDLGSMIRGWFAK